jgi:sugar lactone lactonase YvrE
LKSFAAIVALTTVVGCQGTTEFSPQGSLALIATMDGDPLTVLDVQSGALVERPASELGVLGEDARTLNHPSSLLYYSGGGKLVCFDLTKRAVAWTEAVGGNQDPRWGGQAIYANFALALTPDQQNLLAADSYEQGEPGVAILDVRSRTATGFISALRARMMFAIPPGSTLPDGGVLALGTTLPKTYDDDTERRRGKFYLLSGNPLTVADSIDFLSPADSSAGGVGEMVLDRSGRYAYFTTLNNRVHKYDLQSRQYLKSVQLSAHGPLALSPDGAWLYMIDATQSRDVPGSGFMYVTDQNLTQVDAIDLNGAVQDGLPPQLNSVVTSEDGSLLYIGAGTPARGPVYGTQHGAVIVLDARTRQIQHVFALPTWGVRSVLPL